MIPIMLLLMLDCRLIFPLIVLYVSVLIIPLKPQNISFKLHLMNPMNEICIHVPEELFISICLEGLINIMRRKA